MVHWLRIISLGIFAAIAYGIVHDQITIRICPEYFTIGHPRIVPTSDLTLLALFWGVFATWWVGLAAGIVLAASARIGSRPKWPASRLVKPVFAIGAGSALLATIAGSVGYLLANNGIVYLLPHLAKRIPRSAHVSFLTDLWIHNASYAGGILGSIGLAIYIWRSRGHEQHESDR